jgi:hypothetical protein
VCSETSPYKIQTPENYPERAYSIQNRTEVWKQESNFLFQIIIIIIIIIIIRQTLMMVRDETG